MWSLEEGVTNISEAIDTLVDMLDTEESERLRVQELYVRGSRVDGIGTHLTANGAASKVKEGDIEARQGLSRRVNYPKDSAVADSERCTTLFESWSSDAMGNSVQRPPTGA